MSDGSYTPTGTGDPSEGCRGQYHGRCCGSSYSSLFSEYVPVPDKIKRHAGVCMERFWSEVSVYTYATLTIRFQSLTARYTQKKGSTRSPSEQSKGRQVYRLIYTKCLPPAKTSVNLSTPPAFPSSSSTNNSNIPILMNPTQAKNSPSASNIQTACSSTATKPATASARPSVTPSLRNADSCRRATPIAERDGWTCESGSGATDQLACRRRLRLMRRGWGISCMLGRQRSRL